jgi:hypothetical protein
VSVVSDDHEDPEGPVGISERQVLAGTVHHEETDMTTTQHTYRLTWRDAFWGLTEEDVLEASNLGEAMDLAPEVSQRGLPIWEVAGPDGVATLTPGEPEIHQVQFLGERDGQLVEEVVPAINVAMAFELVWAIAGATTNLAALRVDETVLRLDSVDDSFWSRSDLPEGWALSQ